jgi:3-methyladenine DNA glycosylase AlkD
MSKIEERLFQLQDKDYQEFQSKLLPTIDKNKMIGVRTPDLRKYAKELIKSDYSSFLNKLPHKYFDENQLHAFIISEIKDYNECINYIDKFLPYVDNWATCDQLSPKIFKKNKALLLDKIKEWIKSKDTYTIRFGIGMLMQYYLDEDFNEEYLEWIISIKSNEYYVNMMIAWFFATALAKQYATTIKIIENKKLDIWIHNKTIQKAIESNRITTEQKEYLKGLKIKNIS